MVRLRADIVIMRGESFMGQNLFFFLTNKKNTYFLYDNLSLAESLEILRRHGYTAIPVITREGAYAGSVTEGDFLYYMMDHPDADLQDVTVKSIIRTDFMKPVPINVGMDALLARALEQNFVPVVDDRDVFIGIITRRNIMAYLLKS